MADNKAVALLSDRDLKGRGVEVEVFGEETTLPPGPATLAVKTGAPLFPVATYFEGDGHHVVVRP
ncbi:MAG: phosphatidylinositol mannoside acyltransferase, partial [Thermoplasmata archaeon]|nr:phosphatidylinositol mannoside acyltransferase [Thermoplasmata archaeon]NIT79329.1 phosphatidylinositol mannoside acyltransferase [Thermoplasmata archaeon]NIU50767.1 phosphatidylinositol mannoside acyltransferase [Thermoplasmata archaeon]NIV80487.1 phosphatidylinositol mannoside acyltransferase [Thermoplasmata archaeon]NIW84292.1 phosphatidylinositol mannoside acyltransferase [Thermoplasmata archaeon]